MVCKDDSEDDDRSRVLRRRAQRLATLTEWFAELDDGVCPLLNSWERQVAEEVYSEAQIAANSSGLPPFKGLNGITEKIAIIEDNLKLIIQRLRTYRGDKQHFVREFPNWHKIRRRNVKSLKMLGKSMHMNRFKCNASRLVGNCTSFVGGGICVASAALIPFTLGVSTPLFIAGATTTALGTATSVGTSITEIALLKKKVSDARNIIEEDKLSIKFLEDWLVSSNDLSDARDAILAIDVDKKMGSILETILEMFKAAAAIVSPLQRNEMVKALVKTVISNISPEFVVMAVIPSLTALLLVLALVLYNNRSIIDNASNTTKTVVNKFSSIATIPMQILQPVVGVFIKSEASVAGSVAKAVVTRGLTAALGMSIDAASIILTSIDVHKGSVSEEGKKIIKVADEMEKEASVLQKLYFELISS